MSGFTRHILDREFKTINSSGVKSREWAGIYSHHTITEQTINNKLRLPLLSAFLALPAIHGLPAGSIGLQAGSYSSPCLLSVVYLWIASIFKLVHTPCQPLATCGLPADSIDLPVVHLISRVSASTAVHVSNRILVLIRITWTHNVTLQFEAVEEGMEVADLKWRIFLATACYLWFTCRSSWFLPADGIHI